MEITIIFMNWQISTFFQPCWHKWMRLLRRCASHSDRKIKCICHCKSILAFSVIARHVENMPRQSHPLLPTSLSFYSLIYTHISLFEFNQIPTTIDYILPTFLIDKKGKIKDVKGPSLYIFAFLLPVIANTAKAVCDNLIHYYPRLYIFIFHCCLQYLHLF